MKLELAVSQEEHVEATMLLLARRDGKKRRGQNIYIVSAMLLAWGALGVFGPDPFNLAAGVMLMFLGVFVPIRVSKERQVSWSAYQRVAGYGSVEISADGVRVEYPLVESSYRWEAFTSVWEGQRVMILVTSQRNCVMIPRRAFTSPAELEEFRALAKAKITDRSAGGFPVLPAAAGGASLTKPALLANVGGTDGTQNPGEQRPAEQPGDQNRPDPDGLRPRPVEEPAKPIPPD